MDEKLTYGKVVIDNRGTPEEMERLVRDIWKKEKLGSGD
jgi:dephospho-CoA kinase